MQTFDPNDPVLQHMLDKAAEAGAQAALRHIGLDDENAGNDVRDLRTLLNSYRVVKKVAGRTFIQTVTRIATTVLLALLFAWFLKDGGHFPFSEK